MHDILTNLDAEFTVIGGCLSEVTNRSIENSHTVATLPDDIFSTDATRTMHQAIKNLVKKGREIDGVSFNAEVEKIQPDATSVFAEVLQHGFGVIQNSIQILMECRKRRIIQREADKMLRYVLDPSADIEQISNDAMKAIRDSESVGEIKTIADGMVDFYEDLTKAGQDKKRCYTGIAGLDEMTGGIRGGKLIVLGARPGVGKTALALSMGVHVAKHSAPVLFISLEMDSNEIISRVVAAESGVDCQKMESGNLTADEWQQVNDSINAVSACQLSISTSDRTPNQIRRTATAMKYSKGLGMVIVDYIQLLRSDSKSKSRYEEISEISRELKLIAMDLKVPVLALTQFNRMSEGGTQGQKKRPPTMAEAKDSGSIEQDANMFLILYPVPEPEQQGTRDWEIYHSLAMNGWQLHQLIVAKNRQGRTGNINIGFDKAHMKFTTFKEG